MEQSHKNKEFILEYLKTICEAPAKTREILSKYVDDESLIQHALFFDAVFPAYQIIPEEITAEDNRVVVLARVKGTHRGEFNGIPPTYKNIDFPFAIGYHVENRRITGHWMIADQAALMEQLGIAPALQE
jgi:predicted ester cyclase